MYTMKPDFKEILSCYLPEQPKKAVKTPYSFNEFRMPSKEEIDEEIEKIHKMDEAIDNMLKASRQPSNSWRVWG